MSHACHRFLEMPQNLHVLLTFDKVHNPVCLPREKTSEPERRKVVRACGVFHTLTSKCASPHNGVHFFDISTSKRSEHGVFCTFWFRNAKRASRHNGVQFFISHLPSFSEPIFSTLRSHKSLEKQSVSRLSYLFGHLDLLSSETFSFFDLIFMFTSPLSSNVF